MQATDCAGDAATTPRNTLRQVVSVVAGVSRSDGAKVDEEGKRRRKEGEGKMSVRYLCVHTGLKSVGVAFARGGKPMIRYTRKSYSNASWRIRKRQCKGVLYILC